MALNYPKIRFYENKKKLDIISCSRIVPAPPEQMLSHRLGITTQNFLFFFIDLKKKNTTDNEGEEKVQQIKEAEEF